MLTQNHNICNFLERGPNFLRSKYTNLFQGVFRYLSNIYDGGITFAKDSILDVLRAPQNAKNSAIFPIHFAELVELE